MAVFAKTILSMGAGQWALILLIISIFVDVSPIKINPIRSLLSLLGKFLNSSIEKNISVFKNEVDQKFASIQAEQLSQRETLAKIVKDQDRREVNSLCWSIIDFCNSIANGEKHSREQYRHIIDCSHKYTRMSKMEETKILISAAELTQIIETSDDIKKHYEQGRKDRSNLIF